MKRDLELVREILLQVEAAEPGKVVSSFKVEGKSDPEILEHVDLLTKAGLLEGHVIPDGVKLKSCIIVRLTWAGHEFIANAKSDTVWNKVKEQAGGKFSALSFEVLKALLVKAALTAVGLNPSP